MTTISLKRMFQVMSHIFSGTNLTRKASLNSLAAALDYGARVLVGFIVTPLLVAGLGDALYGMWLVLVRMTGYMSPVSGRPTQALKWVIANRQHTSDEAEKRQYVGGAALVWLLFLPLQTTLGLLVIWYVPTWLYVPEKFAWVVRTAAAVLVLRCILTSLVDIPRAVLEGENLGYKRMGLSAMPTLIGGGFTLLALSLNTGLVGVAAANLATLLLTGLVSLVITRLTVPWLGVVKPSRDTLRQFFGLSGWFLAWRAINLIFRSSDVVLLGILVSAEMVTLYTLTIYLPEMLMNTVGLVVFGISPGLGGIIGGGNLEKATSIRSEMMLLTWFMVTVVGALIILWSESFLSLWVGAQYYAGDGPTVLILVMVSQFIFIRNDSNVIDLTLNLRQKVLLGLLSAVISLGLAVILMDWLNAGVTGLCLGFIAGRSILSVYYPIMVGRALQIPWQTQLMASVRPALVSVALFLGLSKLSPLLTASSWVSFGLAVAATLGGASILTFYAGLTGHQHRQIRRRLQSVTAMRLG